MKHCATCTCEIENRPPFVKLSTERTNFYSQHYAVPCPRDTCQAPAGYRCVSASSGKPTTLHPERRASS